MRHSHLEEEAYGKRGSVEGGDENQSIDAANVFVGIGILTTGLHARLRSHWLAWRRQLSARPLRQDQRSQRARCCIALPVIHKDQGFPDAKSEMERVIGGVQ